MSVFDAFIEFKKNHLPPFKRQDTQEKDARPEKVHTYKFSVTKIILMVI